MSHQRITILDDIVVKQIAAGEIIERPASALRELIDNAIDAQASKIDIYCKNGGLDFLSIDDNGTGILKDDLTLCCTSHATSKISHSKDLYSIKSMGFRGEALASISSVADITITSATQKQEAYTITVQGQKQSSINPSSRTQGTSIEVEHMFYTMPARKKFLSGARTEDTLLKNTLLKKAASFPNIAFSLSSEVNTEKKYTIHIPIEDAFSRAIRICSKQNIEHFLWQDTVSDGDISLCCALGTPNTAQKTRKNMHIYINKRPIKNFSIMQAIEFSYRNALHGSIYPQIVLFLSIPSHTLDVNIHPTKSEVKLLEMDRIRKFIISTLEKKLQSLSSTSPQLEKKHLDFDISTEIPSNASTQHKKYTIPDQTNITPPTKTNIDSLTNMPKSTQKFTQTKLPYSHVYNTNTHISSKQSAYTTKTNSKFNHQSDHNADIKTLETIRSTQKIIRNGFAYAGTVFDTYLVFEKGELLYFFDFHAVHERTIFDALVEKREQTPLLIPIPLTLSKASREHGHIIKEYATCNIGLINKNDTLYLESIPAKCPISADIVARIIEESDATIPQKISSEIFARKACRHAVKAGGTVDINAAFTLLFSALELKEPRCPHGRPIWITMEKKHLDHLIGRI